MVRSRDGNRIQVTGEREPGKQLASGLQQIKSYLSMRGAGGDGDGDELASVVLQYLNSVFHGAHPQSSMSLRNSRELSPECFDALLAGDLPNLGDLLMRRLKAVQTAVVEGNWNLSQHLELTPTSESNVVSPAELRAAQRTQLDQLRLQNSDKGGGKGSARKPPIESRPGRRKSVACSPQATSESRCLNVTVEEREPQGTLEVVSSLHSERSLASSCANAEIASTSSESSTSRITSQGRSTSSSVCAPNDITEPLGWSGVGSKVTARSSPSGNPKLSTRRTDGQKSQFQDERGAKGASSPCTMGRQEEVSTRNESSPLTEPTRSVSGQQELFGVTPRVLNDRTSPHF